MDVKNWLATLNVCIPLDRKILLFGFHDQSSGSVKNYIILCVKYFIWKAKFQSGELCFLAFQQYLKFKLEDLQNAYLFEGKDHKFVPWMLIYDCLSRIQCTGTSEALLPPSSPTSLAPVLVWLQLSITATITVFNPTPRHLIMLALNQSPRNSLATFAPTRRPTQQNKFQSTTDISQASGTESSLELRRGPTDISVLPAWVTTCPTRKTESRLLFLTALSTSSLPPPGHIATQQYDGDAMHADYITIPGASIDTLSNAFRLDCMRRRPTAGRLGWWP